jgi:hypothetical protein
MTYYPHYDRTDWRALSTQTLIYAAQDCPHELAIALGERLEELEGFDTHTADLEAENADLRSRIEALELTIAELEAALGYSQ